MSNIRAVWKRQIDHSQINSIKGQECLWWGWPQQGVTNRTNRNTHTYSPHLKMTQPSGITHILQLMLRNHKCQKMSKCIIYYHHHPNIHSDNTCTCSHTHDRWTHKYVLDHTYTLAQTHTHTLSGTCGFNLKQFDFTHKVILSLPIQHSHKGTHMGVHVLTHVVRRI